jgi:hypothetical protein
MTQIFTQENDQTENQNLENKEWFLASQNKWFLSKESKVFVAGKDSWFINPLQTAKTIHKISKKQRPDISKVQIQLSKDPELLKQYYDLREDIYKNDSGYKNYSGSENSFDKNGQIFLAIEDGVVVAGARLVVSNNVAKLPHENLEAGFTYQTICSNFNIDLNGTIYSEISALIIKKGFRNDLLKLLFKSIVQFCRETNIKYIFGVANMKCNRDYKIVFSKIGVKSFIADKIIAPRKPEFNNIDSYPIIIMPLGN